MFRIDSEVRKVCWLLENKPEEWEQASEYRLRHKETKVELWVTGSNIDFYPTKVGLSYRERKCLRKAIKRMFCRKVTNGPIRSGETG